MPNAYGEHMLTNILIFAMVFGLFWLVANRLGGGSERQRMIQRIARLRNRKAAGPKIMQDVSLRRKSADTKGLIHWLMKPLPDFKRLGDRLEWTGQKVSPKQYAFRRLLTLLIIMFLVCGIMHKSILLGFFLGVIIGVWLPLKLLQRNVTKLNKAFLRLFPDAIDLIVRGLRSGLPVSESLVLVSTEVPEPVGGVFANIGNTMKLGVSLEKALQETARKLDMTEFNFFTTSIILQRETGGNLSEILQAIWSEVLRGRYIMRMKIRAISSEARAASYIISALPFFVIGAVSFVSPAYLVPLYTDPTGKICAGVAASMLTFGLWIMNRMTKFDI